MTFLSDCQSAIFHQSAIAKLFFVDSKVLSIDKNFGCIYISTERLEDANFLFHFEEIRVDKSKRGWSYLENIKHSCNAIVITDNYLFSENNYMENIKSIFESLMPDYLEDGFTFDITLIGFNTKSNFRPIEKQYEEIEVYLKSKFSYQVNLTIIRAQHHDRSIFTNYYQITSGNGFSLFENKKLVPGKSTTLTCKPLAYVGRLSSAIHIRNQEIEQCIVINRTDRTPDMLAGTRINRLLA